MCVCVCVCVLLIRKTSLVKTQVLTHNYVLLNLVDCDRFRMGYLIIINYVWCIQMIVYECFTLPPLKSVSVHFFILNVLNVLCSTYRSIAK